MKSIIDEFISQKNQHKLKECWEVPIESYSAEEKNA